MLTYFIIRDDVMLTILLKHKLYRVIKVLKTYTITCVV